MLAVLVALPVAAQNTDIESLAGLQFNFGNPGARSLGMGGAFLGLSDDASAAEANPAGLTILRKPEMTLEARNYEESQILTTSGSFPDVERTAFNHHSERLQIGFASVVYPIRNFTFGAYYHVPLRNSGAGIVIPQRNPFSGVIEKDVPLIFLPRDGGGGPLSERECEKLRIDTNDPFACREGFITPFVTAVDIQQRTFGVAGGWQISKNFSVGAGVRYQTLREEAVTVRFDSQTLFVNSITAQATGHLNDDGEVDVQEESDVSLTGGFKWMINDRFSVGGVYKQGPTFVAPIFGLTPGQEVQGPDVKFHVPDVYGLGVAFRPIPAWTFTADAVRVTYSNLTDDFVSIIGELQELEGPVYKANDVTELRLGSEYFLPTKIPMAIRAGFWRDPAHSIEYQGPLNTFDTVGSAILYPKGETQNHYSIGGGLAWTKFQIDVAYDSSPNYKGASASFVVRR